jgi:hypothetical protein
MERTKTKLKLSPRPYRQWRHDELPKNHVLEDYESESDIWLKADGKFYNLNEFCTVGCPTIPMPRGDAQTAAGPWMIAAHDGEIWGVSRVNV